MLWRRFATRIRHQFLDRVLSLPLAFEARPDYTWLRKLFRNLLLETETKGSDDYQWDWLNFWLNFRVRRFR